MTEVPLITSDGKPVTDKAGAPIVKKLADCAGSTDQDTCRELFLNVSNCKISRARRRFDSCIKDKVSSWVDANASSESP